MKKIILSVVLVSFPILLPVAAAADCRVSKDQYSALRSDMTYRQAVSILGCEGEEMSSSEMMGIKSVMLTWKGTSVMGNMNAMFQNGKLVSKAQFGLE